MYRCNVKMYIHIRSTLLTLLIHTQLISISLPTFIQKQQQQQHSCHNHYTSLSNIVDISLPRSHFIGVESLDPFSIILCSMLHAMAAQRCHRSSYIYLYLCLFLL